MKGEGSNAKLGLPDRVSIDSGVLLAYFLGEELAGFVKGKILQPQLRAVFFNHVAVAETFYILCRRRGVTVAREVVETFLRTGYANLLSSDELDIQAGSYKCDRNLSLADCYVLAAAKIHKAAALFAKKEKDVEQEMARQPFDVEILFLEDFLNE